jgi:uncharacterized coiled-coil protein SlyX
MDETIIKLQTMAEHQEEEISNLSKELYTQQQELQKLKQQMALLVDRFRAFSDAAAEATQDKEPPPPHY